MIQVILAGGMGNQMFEYAFAVQVQQQNPAETICINPAFLHYRRDKRSNSLCHLKLMDSVVMMKGGGAHVRFFAFLARLPYLFGVKNVIDKIKKRFRDDARHQQRRVKRGFYHTCGIYEYVPPVPSEKKRKYIYGYFQNVQTVSNIESILKQQFEIITPPSEQNKKMLEEIRSSNAVCLHVRRGDYLEERFRQLQVCNYAYYTEAIKRAKTTLEGPRFFVFSTGHNDIEWIKNNYMFDADITYVDLDNPDYEELRLMRACRHFIISNSTFSWWAAFLGDAHDKKVWAPEFWLQQSDVNMHLPTWEKVPCQNGK